MPVFAGTTQSSSVLSLLLRAAGFFDDALRVRL
jgi:hypothetical protein